VHCADVYLNCLTEPGVPAVPHADRADQHTTACCHSLADLHVESCWSTGIVFSVDGIVISFRWMSHSLRCGRVILFRWRSHCRLCGSVISFRWMSHRLLCGSVILFRWMSHSWRCGSVILFRWRSHRRQTFSRHHLLLYNVLF